MFRTLYELFVLAVLSSVMFVIPVALIPVVTNSQVGAERGLQSKSLQPVLLQLKPVGRAPKQQAPPLALCLPVKIIAVHDGDTAKCTVEFQLTVRYANCWAPELRDPLGPKSAESARLAIGKAGRLFVDLSNVHNLADCLTFGRVVGEVWLDGSAESESARQVRLKLASTRKGAPLGE